MTRKKKGTDIIKPVPEGVRMAATMANSYAPNDQFLRAFLAGVNYVLTLNGYEPMKL